MNYLAVRLKIDNTEREYVAPRFISSDVFMRTLDLEDELDHLTDYKIIFTKSFPLICEIFGNQFNEEELRKGIDVRDVMPLLYDTIDYVITEMTLSNSYDQTKKEFFIKK